MCRLLKLNPFELHEKELQRTLSQSFATQIATKRAASTCLPCKRDPSEQKEQNAVVNDGVNLMFNLWCGIEYNV